MAKTKIKQPNKKKTVKKKIENYKCKICKKQFTDSSGLAHHMKLHSAERPYSCGLCPYTCKTKKYLTKHEKTVHKAATENACEYCNKKFHYKCLLDKHMLVHTNEKPYKCELCGKGFNSNYSLGNHKNIHLGAKPYKCDTCDYSCRDSSTLRKHRERHSNIASRYQCKICDKSYTTKSVLKVHISEAHFYENVKTKACQVCGKAFKSMSILNSHIKIVHDRVHSCTCDICGVTISNKYNMAAHLTKHSTSKPFACDFVGCGKSFKDKSTLKKHSIIHYPLNQHQCSICHRRFARLYRLNAHKKLHFTKFEDVVCDYCGRSFVNKGCLRIHMSKKHTNRRKYVCDMCGLVTHNKPSIVMHIKYGHGSETDLQCKICKKRLKKHSYLKMHYWRTHCVRYNMMIRKPKEEPKDEDYMEILQDVKVEPVTEPDDDGITKYTNDLLYENISDVFNKRSSNKQTKYDFYIKRVNRPNFNVRGATIFLEKYENDVIQETEESMVNDLNEMDYEIDDSVTKYENNDEITEYYEDDDKRLEETDDNDVKSTENHFNNDFIDESNEIDHKSYVTDSKLAEKDNTNVQVAKSRNNKPKTGNKLGTLTKFAKNKNNESLKKLDIDKIDKSIDNNETSNGINNEKDETLNNDDRIENDEEIENDQFDDDLNDSDYYPDEVGEIDGNTRKKKVLADIHQCYVCFKLYKSKEKLLEHCKIHFDICNSSMLKKCPLCEFVTKYSIQRHLKLVHKINIKLPYGKLKDKQTDKGPRYYYEINNKKISEIEVIPSIKNLNKREYMKLDKQRREVSDKSLTKTKLVKKNGEWVVEKIKLDENYVLPKIDGENYLDRMKVMYRVAKKNGQKMMFPCEKCDKICQTMSALILHMRRHDPNPKPFKKKIWKHKTNIESESKVESINSNRYTKPKPILNKHKCDENLKKFYESNIMGGDIEFCHFLKIFNKMSRENINDFSDLENRKEFGIHYSLPVEKTNVKIKRKNAFKRTILISKKNYERRKLGIDELRKKISNNK